MNGLFVSLTREALPMLHVKTCIWICVVAALTGICTAQEFPIAVGNDNTSSGGGAFDGTNFLVTILGDAQSPNSITAQFMGSGGALIGPRISLGHTGSGPIVAFDGTRYLVVWTDIFPLFAGGDTNGIGNIYGQFLSTTGSLLGTTFTLVTNANIRFGKGRGDLTFRDTTYLLTYLKGGNHTDYLYGQRISRSGAAIGSPIQISSSYAREFSIAFDGTNYLVSWCKVAYPSRDKDIYGQFINPSGVLVGTNFLIDGSSFASDNPVSMTFDGSRYWVGFHDQAADTTGRWNLNACFVSPSGVIADRFTICDSSKNPTFAAAAFDGSNYLITWLDLTGPVRVKGRFFSPTGNPIAAPFTVFDTLGGKFPVGGVSGFLAGKFFLGATRFGANYSDGDIYGKFLQPSTTGANGDAPDLSPKEFVLSQNYPNPFNPSTTIRYGLPQASKVTLTVYNMLGQQVAVLQNGEQDAGYHDVRFDASGLSSGVYFYRMTAGTYVESRKLLLIR
jgi:hypothetical protein